MRTVTALLFALTTAPLQAQSVVALPDRDRPLRDEPAEIFIVGTTEGADWEMFSGVRAVAFDRADNLYVLDAQNVRVVVFDTAGRYVHEFGTRGGGPGEFQVPVSMTVLANNEVVVNDVGNRAYIVFDADGEFLRSVPYDASIGLPLGGVHGHPLGIVARANPMPSPGGDGTRPRVAPVFVQPLREDAGPITLFETPLPPPLSSDQTGGRGGIRMIAMDPVFGARPSFGVLPDGGLALHHETGYRIHVLDRGGRAVRTITRAHEPRRVTKKDQEEWDERRRNGEGPTMQSVAVMRSGGGTSVSVGSSRSGGGGGAPSAGSMQFSLDDMPFAEFMSVITSVRTDPQGRVWVQRRHADATEQGPIDLITANGRYIGTLPAQQAPNAVSASDRAAYIVTDELGVERVSVRRLPSSWR